MPDKTRIRLTPEGAARIGIDPRHGPFTAEIRLHDGVPIARNIMSHHVPGQPEMVADILSPDGYDVVTHA